MTAIAPHISAFLRERLPLQRGASEHTCAAYAYAFSLLFKFAGTRFHVPPSRLSLEQLDAPLVTLIPLSQVGLDMVCLSA